MVTDTKGLVAAVISYGLWGVFPLYFHLLNQAGALEIVGHRLVWTLLFCAIGVSLIGAWGQVRQVWADRRLLISLLVAGVLVSLNWLIYIYAVVVDRVVDGALGYFINPLVTVVLAVVFLRERLRPGQAIALGIGLVAVIVIIVGYKQVPWIGLGLALSFGGYSLAKNRVAHRASPVVGLGFEALALGPLAAVYLIVLEATGRGHFLTGGWVYAGLLVGTGIVTAIPLLFFAIGAARLSLTSLALIQYITPIMQFSIGVWIMGEQMPLVRWIGFILIWLALVVLTVDLVLVARRQPKSSPEVGPAGRSGDIVQ